MPFPDEGVYGVHRDSYDLDEHGMRLWLGHREVPDTNRRLGHSFCNVGYFHG